MHDVHILWDSYFTFQVICLLFIIFVDKIFRYNAKNIINDCYADETENE